MSEFFITLLVIVGALSISVGAVWLAWKLLHKQFAGKSLLAGGLTAVGIIVGLWLIANLWPKVAVGIVMLSEGPLKVNPMWPAAIIAAAVAVGLVGLNRLAQKALELVNAKPWIQACVKFVLTVSAVATVLYLLGFSAGFGNAFWWTTHAAVVVLFGWYTIGIIARWNPDGQNTWGLPASYIVCLVLTSILTNLLGFGAGGDLWSSLTFVMIFASMNFAIFWLAYGMGRPNPDMKKRIMYKPLLLWCLIFCLFYIYLSFNMLFGRISVHEMLTCHDRNFSGMTVETIKRDRAFNGHETLMKEFAKAQEAGDLERTEEIRKKLIAQDEAQRAISKSREARRLPQAIEDDLADIKGLFGHHYGGAKDKTVTTFNQTYTFADAVDDYGQVDTIRFGKDDVKVGDVVSVTATLLGSSEFSGKEIAIILGKEFNPYYVLTENGKRTWPIEVVKPGKVLTISLRKRQDVEVRVMVTRKV